MTDLNHTRFRAGIDGTFVTRSGITLFQHDDGSHFSTSLVDHLPGLERIIHGYAFLVVLEPDQGYLANNHRHLHGRMSFTRPHLTVVRSHSSDSVSKLLSWNVDKTLCCAGDTRINTYDPCISHGHWELHHANPPVNFQGVTEPLMHSHILYDHTVTARIDQSRQSAEKVHCANPQSLELDMHSSPPSGSCHSARKTLNRPLPVHKSNLRGTWIRLRWSTSHWCSRFLIITILNFSLVGHTFARPVTQARELQSCISVTKAMIFTAKVKGSATILALLSAVLIITTYYILIGASTRLATSSRIPFSSIAQNIESLLKRTWPDTSSSVVCETTADLTAKPDAIRLLYVGRMGNETRRTARGLQQCEALPDTTITTPPFWLTSGSPLMTSLVQLAVWEWVFLWMNAFMVIATLLYNGNFTHTPGPDSYLRLTVVLIYGMAYLFHAAFVWYTFSTFLTLVAMGSTWSLLNRASFTVVDLVELERRLRSPTERTPINFRTIDRASAEFTPGSYSADLAHETTTPHTIEASQGDSAATFKTMFEIGPHLENERELREALGTISKVQEHERQNCRDCADAALDRVVANGMIMVAIILASGFSVWSKATGIFSDVQTGSLALLASFSLGGMAMFTSAVKITMANSSFKEILHFKEVRINGQAVEYTKKRVSVSMGVGFTYETVKARKVQLRDLVKITSFVDVPLFLLFGPGYSLLPTRADQTRVSTGTQFGVMISIRDARVVLTTGGTNKHSKDEKGMNIEAINVCFQPPAMPTGIQADAPVQYGT